MQITKNATKEAKLKMNRKEQELITENIKPETVKDPLRTEAACQNWSDATAGELKRASCWHVETTLFVTGYTGRLTYLITRKLLPDITQT